MDLIYGQIVHPVVGEGMRGGCVASLFKPIASITLLKYIKIWCNILLYRLTKNGKLYYISQKLCVFLHWSVEDLRVLRNQCTL